MKRSILSFLSIALLLGTQANAQRCGAGRIKEELIKKNPDAAAWFAATPDRVSHTLQNLELSAQHKTTQSYAIPVIFHVVLNSSALADAGGVAGIAARATSQIDELNSAYAGLDADSINIPAPFKAVWGKSSIRFALAHTNPEGKSTLGYEITNTTKSSFSFQNNDSGSTYIYSDAKYSGAGGADGWDPTRYLNIWIIKMSASGELGATFPLSYTGAPFFIPMREIGVALSYDAFGERSSAATVFKADIDKGKTLVHEIGHFFELIHIWGDDNGACPGQSNGVDDGFSDTPPQASETYGDPAFPRFDACTATGNGIMFNNYMDYVNDSSLLMFTAQQSVYMDALVAPGGTLYSLTQHPELTQFPVGVHDVVNSYNVSVFPNPSNGMVTVAIPAGLEKLKALSVINILGQPVKMVPLSSLKETNTIDMTSLAAGVYTIRCSFEDQIINRKIILQQ